MKMLSYDYIIKKITDYSKNKCFMERKIVTEKEKQYLKKFYSNSDTNNVYFNDIDIIDLFDMSIISFETIDYETSKVVNNIILLRDDKLLFKGSHSILSGDNIKSESINYITYEKDTNYIYRKVEYSSITLGNMSQIDIHLLKEKDSTFREYSEHNYTFYQYKDGVKAFKNHGITYIDTENGFVNRLDVMENNVNNMLTNIENQLNEILGLDYTKEYKIKRKNKNN